MKTANQPAICAAFAALITVTAGSSNGQQFPSVSGQTKGLLVNADGSVDVYFGPKARPGRENNWVQSVPGEGYNVALRLYGPLDPWFDKTWRPGEIEPIK